MLTFIFGSISMQLHFLSQKHLKINVKKCKKTWNHNHTTKSKRLPHQYAYTQTHSIVFGWDLYILGFFVFNLKFPTPETKTTTEKKKKKKNKFNQWKILVHRSLEISMFRWWNVCCLSLFFYWKCVSFLKIRFLAKLARKHTHITLEREKKTQHTNSWAMYDFCVLCFVNSMAFFLSLSMFLSLFFSLFFPILHKMKRRKDINQDFSIFVNASLFWSSSKYLSSTINIRVYIFEMKTKWQNQESDREKEIHTQIQTKP